MWVSERGGVGNLDFHYGCLNNHTNKFHARMIQLQSLLSK